MKGLKIRWLLFLRVFENIQLKFHYRGMTFLGSESISPITTLLKKLPLLFLPVSYTDVKEFQWLLIGLCLTFR